ncbi:unnamed protein product [Thelazia callipaeda]|uniref:ANK_REP_REGION domain-containing protein n=1 Tax=Thelazia callipaeda TaxID=103827 RepID=A0A0N5CZ28_THECL|nr:unnamed protein product [Thelazia callipaeda]
MACERWLQARLDSLRTKNLFGQRRECDHLPQKLEKTFVDFDINEKNVRGETLIMSVIRYEADKANQMRYINLLIRSGCDPSEPDKKQLRTPLMLACIVKNDTVAHHLIMQNVNLLSADKMGNTVLMYAAIYSHTSLMNLLIEKLSGKWCIEAFRAKNLMGYTAESLARKNERYLMLRKARLRLVKRLRDHVAAYLTLHSAKQKFLMHKQRFATTSQNKSSLPIKNVKSLLPLLNNMQRKDVSKNPSPKTSFASNDPTEASINLPPLLPSPANILSTSISGTTCF